MSAAKRQRELNRAKKEHENAKLSAQIATGNVVLTNIAESVMEKLIERQAAQIEMLREALGHAFNGILYYHHAKLVKIGIDAANEALSISPDQALERFAERVRNQCAEVCADTEPVFDGYGYQCAVAIRAIKELP
mgnify:CR=1 FL=1